MQYMQVPAGSADVSVYVDMRLAADDAPATGLTITDFDIQYTRDGAAPAAKVDATALATTATAHTDNKGIEVDATSSPGLYRFDFPDAAFAGGVKKVILALKVATAKTAFVHVDLTGVPPVKI